MPGIIDAGDRRVECAGKGNINASQAVCLLKKAMPIRRVKIIPNDLPGCGQKKRSKFCQSKSSLRFVKLSLQ
jgi:hypothetical protein